MSFITDSIKARISHLASQTCVELFEDYGLSLTPGPVGWTATTERPVLFGVIGFAGSGLRATCLFGAEEGVVQASSRGVGAPRDWVAELSNQLIGRLKIKLLKHGVTVAMTTPLALSGVHCTPLPRPGQTPLEFRSDKGSVLVWLELEAKDSVELDASKPLSVAPGDIFF